MITHPILALPYYLVVLLERLGYYGVRSIILIYITDVVINMPLDQAYKLIGLGATAVAISYFVGGLLGMIVNQRLLSIIGLSLQGLACCTIGIYSDPDMITYAFLLFSFGTGLYRPNQYGVLAGLYQQDKLVDSAVMINFAVINIGAFLGVIGLTYFAEKMDYQTAFFAAGGIFGIAALLNALIKTKPLPKKVFSDKSIPMMSLVIFFGTITAVLYWVSHSEINDTVAFNFFSGDDSLTSQMIYPNSSYINYASLLFFCTIAAIFLSFKRVSTTILISIGLGAALVAIGILASLDQVDLMSDQNAYKLAAFFIFYSVAEIFITAPLTSYIVRKISIRFVPLMVETAYILQALIIGFVGVSQSESISAIIKPWFWIFGLLLSTFVALAFLRPKPISQNGFKDVDEIV